MGLVDEHLTGWVCLKAGHVTARTKTEGPPITCPAPLVRDRHGTCGDRWLRYHYLRPPRGQADA